MEVVYQITNNKYRHTNSQGPVHGEKWPTGMGEVMHCVVKLNTPCDMIKIQNVTRSALFRWFLSRFHDGLRGE